jgi:hypothetical protein
MPPRKSPRKITDEMLDVARDLIAAGVAMREAAAALECVDSTFGVTASETTPSARDSGAPNTHQPEQAVGP